MKCKLPVTCNSSTCADDDDATVVDGESIGLTGVLGFVAPVNKKFFHNIKFTSSSTRHQIIYKLNTAM